MVKATVSAGLVALLTLSGCTRPPTCEECVQRLAAGTPQEQIREALRVLFAAEMEAFPTLVDHFADTAPAEPAFFQQAVMEIGPDGSLRDHPPTIGEACFGVFQWQIEGNWPKGYRVYYTLTPGNAQAWLDDHRGMTLAELRVAAAQESLRRAEADAAASPDIDYEWILEFLRTHLQKAKKGRWDGES